jgi:uncharacterized delta-60 repeat protein
VERQVSLDFTAEDVVVESSGRALVLGQGYSMYLAHYGAGVRAFLPDGRADASYGQNGTAPLPAAPYSSGGGGRLLLQPDGRLIVAELWNGTYADASGGRRPLLRRLNPDGTPDGAFGDGGAAEPALGTPSGTINAVALQPDGGILVAGSVDHNGASSLTVTRHLRGGATDVTFGEGGRVTLSAPEPAVAAQLAVAPDGGFTVLASTSSRSLHARLDARGTGATSLAPLQVEYADGGSARFIVGAPPITLATGDVRVPGSVVLPGESLSRMAVLGLSPAGEVDPRYGRGGLALGPPAARSDPQGGEVAKHATLDRAGGIVLTGAENRAEDSRSIARRFGPDGRLDRSYGRFGGVLLGVHAWTDYVRQGVAANPGGGVVASTADVYGKFGIGGPSLLRWLRPGPDADAPRIRVRAGCRVVRIRIVDATQTRVVVRAGARRIETKRRRLRMRRPASARRVRVTATDIAGNRTTERTRLPRC